MTPLSLPESEGGGRFPGFNVLDQADHWDPTTRDLITARVSTPPPVRFFSEHEAATAHALFDLLLDLHDDEVPVVAMVDSRLFENQTDGWHYDTMPQDSEAWRRSLAGLDRDCEERYGLPFSEAAPEAKLAVLKQVDTHDSSAWHGLDASHIWNLWMRYACTAFYSHPSAWSEIGFDGPAYPRGYKNLGVDRREPFEVRDASPSLDPEAESNS